MNLRTLTDADLLARLKSLIQLERQASADALACMSEIQRRSLLPNSAVPSLFKYCVLELKLSEASAFRRMRAVKAADLRPEIYSFLRSGDLNFTTISLAQPLLKENPDILDAIKGKTTREVERIVASISPEASAKLDRIRVVAMPPSPAIQSSPRPEPPSGPPEVLDLLAPPPQPAALRAEIRFSAGEDFLEALDRLKALLWHKHPDGRLEDVLLEPMNEFLERRDPARPRRKAASRRPDARARKPPAAVEREVRLRDGQRCAFVDGEGRRCGETRSLEVDHVTPWALGGRSDDAANLRLLCRAHNQREMRRAYRKDQPGREKTGSMKSERKFSPGAAAETSSSQ